MKERGSACQEPGRLIVLEGPDGVGKSTLAELLCGELSRLGRRCTLLRFPGKEPGSLGGLVYELHHNPELAGVQAVDPTALQALHVAAHLDEIATHIKPSLASGQDVVLDRFWWSTAVYGLSSGCDPDVIEGLLAVEKLAWGSLRPVAAFLILRPEPIDRDVNPAAWNLLIDRYKDLASQENAILVENTASPSEALQSLLRHIPEAPGPGTGQGALPLEIPPHPRSFLWPMIRPAKPSNVFDTYWRFAKERQDVFFNRLAAPSPWTDDPILRQYKFTNAYRASDRVSQYLIRHVIYESDLDISPEDVVFRILLFKLFNKIETWQFLRKQFGELSYKTFDSQKYSSALLDRKSQGHQIYSAAYIMPSGQSRFGSPAKHANHLALLELMMSAGLAAQLASARRMQDAYEILIGFPTIGPFLAYQLVTDINYSELTDYSEMEFVMPGPGARDGLRKCFMDAGGLNDQELIQVVTEVQEEAFAVLGLEFRNLWGRKLQLIDCQNLFCEVDKYARVAHPEARGITGRTRIKQRFNPRTSLACPWYPPKWGINERIQMNESDRRQESNDIG